SSFAFRVRLTQPCSAFSTEFTSFPRLELPSFPVFELSSFTRTEFALFAVLEFFWSAFAVELASFATEFTSLSAESGTELASFSGFELFPFPRSRTKFFALLAQLLAFGTKFLVLSIEDFVLAEFAFQRTIE